MKDNLPPGPTKLPVIGNLHQLQGLLHRCLHDLSKKHGPVLFLRQGFVQMVVLSSSEAAEEALKTHDLECCNRPMTNALLKFSRNGKDIAFAAYEVSRELRKLSILNFLSAKKVRSFRYIREEETDLMIKKLKESAQKKSPVDLSKTLFHLSASIVFRAAFGQSFLENKHINKEEIEELMYEAQRINSYKFSDLFPIAGVGWFIDFVSGQHKRFHNVFSKIDTFLNLIVNDHHQLKSQTQDRPDIVDSLLHMIHKQDQDESFKLTIDHLKGIISLVVKETLRLHPAAPLLLPRETASQIKIQGYNIPPKTLLLVNAWSIGRDPKQWENPEEFIPERFIDCPVDYKGQSFEMLPFGSGRRICPGIAFGIAAIELGLLNLLYYFDWRLPENKEDMDMEEAGYVTTVKKVPLELVPSPIFAIGGVIES
uniref:Cytochrome P450 n=1 Tax=Brassica campestris TaxID=3711 RepID=M4FDR0_BRACM